MASYILETQSTVTAHVDSAGGAPTCLLCFLVLGFCGGFFGVVGVVFLVLFFCGGLCFLGFCGGLCFFVLFFCGS
jgi:hypothetical protein